jgi:hypothetical protein
MFRVVRSWNARDISGMTRGTAAWTSGVMVDERRDQVTDGGTGFEESRALTRTRQTETPGFKTAPFGTMMIPFLM